jgi:hypothetical protein
VLSQEQALRTAPKQAARRRPPEEQAARRRPREEQAARPPPPEKQAARLRPPAPRGQRRHTGRPAPSRVLKVGGPALAVMLTAAALGFTFARTEGSGPGQRTVAAHAPAGVLEISLPSGWVRRVAPSGLSLNLSDEIVAAPSASSRAILAVGRTVAVDPGLLPPSLLASLPSAPQGLVVTLGGSQFYRYLNLSPRGGQGPEAVYAMSTTKGAVLGMCLTQGAPPGLLGSCEHSLATLRLTSGSVLPLGPIPAYASALNLAMSRLNAVRVRLGSQLLNAQAASAQAGAAYALAAAHTAAASALGSLEAGPANAANAAVVTALKLNGAAYRALGRAASLQDQAAYNQATTSVERATNAWKAAYSRLGAFGYSVS